MLGSLKSSSSSSHYDDETDEAEPPSCPTDPPPQICLSISQSSSSSSAAAHHLQRLLLNSAELVAQSDFVAAHRLVSILSANCSPYGDSTERLVHQFAKALSVRISRSRREDPTTALALSGCAAAATSDMISSTVFTSSICKEQFLLWANSSSDHDYFESCYLWLNQITPFIRFSHLTANQAILDVTEIKQEGAIHILDLDITQGLQWPPLMQALAERSNPNPPPVLRITGCGRDIAGLNRTGDRLSRFAQSLGLRFQFQPLMVQDDDPASLAIQLRPAAISVVPGETLAVNCVLYLHKLLNDDPRDIRLFFSAIKSLNPKIFTVAEREAYHSNPAFMQRFTEAMDHYAAVFDSLEATLPPNSRERLTLEQTWFGPEIVDVVAAQGAERRLRHQRFEMWEAMLRSSGFSNVAIGGFALSQAKLLLRLHYPSEGYQLQFLKNSLFLGWQNRLLFSVSSWR